MVKFKLDRDIKYQTPIKNNRCVIVIPIYKHTLTNLERNSLLQCFDILGEHWDIILMCPDGMDLANYKQIIPEGLLLTSEFDGSFFRSQRSYSDLCETWQFYETFKFYDYMLIYQLDAWIFEDKLEEFIGLEYDYYGGPHLMGFKEKDGICGNGGFSLRKVDTFIRICKETDFSKFSLLEDRVFCENLKNKLNLPPIDICRKFSFHENPVLCFSLNHNELPMGCHNIIRTKNFWKNYINYGDKENSKNIINPSSAKTSNIIRRFLENR